MLFFYSLTVSFPILLLLLLIKHLFLLYICLLTYQVLYLSFHLFLLFVSMGRDVVSELRPPAGLFFIPQVINEHEGPW
jgi:hypothetical protein